MQRRTGAFVVAASLVVALSGIVLARAGDTVALPEALAEDDFRPFGVQRAELGRMLFFDKEISGNRNISCGTCHDHALGTGDGLSLGIGEGAMGLGVHRVVVEGLTRPRARMSRNSMPLFNLGHRDMTVFLHDGRVSDEDIYGVGFNSPAEEWLPSGFQSALAVQSVMPTTVEVEMAGEAEENELGSARHQRIDFVWPLVVERIVAIPAYVDMFVAAFDDVDRAEDITIAHVGNALDDFIGSEWRAWNTPFDRYLRGDETALSSGARAGMDLFFGKADCASCHSGPLLTDLGFHALAIPPFGPGRVRPFDPYARDVGRMAESDLIEDAYRFRTPPLRNVAETGPWGHNGAYATLEGIVRHHLDPLAALDAWDRTQVVMPENAAYEATDFVVLADRLEMARYRSRLDIEPVDLTDDEVAALVAFLEALTDEESLKGRLGKPDSVPSGLPLD